jgi:hypothetical protein
MTDDEKYEQLKREIGWHCTGWDVLSALLVMLVLIVWFA